ncbi:hypothetical protein PIB30_057258 [Stylosanthes scabra]|uniref:Uncharacterized protein n=1 Tax=Stylosanthes scabra TaxID=79078 RepID=A0ABU6WLB3_9FABA|nr:hypothetical protein [Stylosanthes scabra]
MFPVLLRKLLSIICSSVEDAVELWLSSFRDDNNLLLSMEAPRWQIGCIFISLELIKHMKQCRSRVLEATLELMAGASTPPVISNGHRCRKAYVNVFSADSKKMCQCDFVRHFPLLGCRRRWPRWNIPQSFN